MRVTILAVGRLRTGPEAELVADYLARFDQTGRSLGLGPAHVIELEKRGGRSGTESALLVNAVPKGAKLIVLDERGQELDSPGFAAVLQRSADTGIRNVAFAIGGAGGLDRNFRDRADHVLSFGRMVWPHMLARVLLAEQLYRAVSILAGTPYHRA